MGHNHHQSPYEAGEPKRSCSCGGGSVEDARAMGCVFDILASAWLPPWCRDSELTHEFNHAGPGADGEWTFYKDTDGNETMSLDEVGELGNHPGQPWFSTYEWHVLHCVYNWRKMFRARTLGTILEPYYDHEMHIIHCGEMFLYNSFPQAIITGSGVTTTADHVPYTKEHDN
ncbi:hypothetical protein IFR05_016288 [Cadophora sp. M221]|nr:hypothetical protein IFR05_016288 [Cadophora sp. M221]